MGKGLKIIGFKIAVVLDGELGDFDRVPNAWALLPVGKFHLAL